MGFGKNNAWFFLLLIFLVGINGPAFAGDTSSVVSCGCEDVSCGPCEMETGTTFFTTKCGPGNRQVKSCKKPTCEPVENQKACLALFNREPEKKVLPRDPASMRASKKNNVVQASGEIEDVVGPAKILRSRGSSETVKKGVRVYEGDVVRTTSESRIKIVLNDKSVLILPPDSEVKIEEAKSASDAGGGDALRARRVMIELLKGKVRSHVTKKTNGDENYFKVRTRSAVAGVRGTEFVVKLEQGPKEWRTEVHTISGRVDLERAFVRADELAPRQIEVPAGTYAAFIMEAPPQGVSDVELARLSSQGTLSPVFSMTEEEMKLLLDSTDLKPSRPQSSRDTSSPVATAKEESLCNSPNGEFNQCSFICEGNPKGEKKCRTDLQGVRCIRRLCRANGVWAEPKRMMASQSDQCEGAKAVVRDCGTYW